MINNLEYYKVFYHVAKSGSLTSAAEELAISQPAVSQSVRQLENALGTRLFVRAPRGVSDMTLQFYLLPFLERFHEKYPGIRVAVTNAPTPETLQNLQDGKIDFGVVSTPFSENAPVCAEKVREIEDIFVAGRKFIQYKNKMLDLQELEKMPLIFLEGITSTRHNMEKFLLENEVEVHPEFELATSEMIVQFALRNLGIGCVVRDFAREYLEDGQLFELRFNKIIPRRHFCVVTDRRNPMSAATENLLRLFREQRSKDDREQRNSGMLNLYQEEKTERAEAGND